MQYLSDNSRRDMFAPSLLISVSGCNIEKGSILRLNVVLSSDKHWCGDRKIVSYLSITEQAISSRYIKCKPLFVPSGRK